MIGAILELVFHSKGNVIVHHTANQGDWLTECAKQD